MDVSLCRSEALFSSTREEDSLPSASAALSDSTAVVPSRLNASVLQDSLLFTEADLGCFKPNKDNYTLTYNMGESYLVDGGIGSQSTNEGSATGE
jgi:hypothetical protein